MVAFAFALTYPSFNLTWEVDARRLSGARCLMVCSCNSELQTDRLRSFGESGFSETLKVQAH